MENNGDELIKVIRPFGPSIARVKIPNDLVQNLNKYIDKIILDDLDEELTNEEICQKQNK